MKIKKTRKLLARKYDNFLAIGAGVGITVVGIHLHWYAFYICEVLAFVVPIVAFWRLPAYVLCQMFSKDKEFWDDVISQYTYDQD